MHDRNILHYIKWFFYVITSASQFLAKGLEYRSLNDYYSSCSAPGSLDPRLKGGPATARRSASQTLKGISPSPVLTILAKDMSHLI